LHGKGEMIFSDGTKIEGNWINGEYQLIDNNSNSNTSANDVIPAASGSGFAVTDDGYIITNHHVIDGCQNVEIINKGTAIPATVVSFDTNNDLALLKSDFKPSHTFPLSRKNPYTLMEIYVAGFPFGYDISTSIKITKGIISSLSGIGNNFSQMQIDAAIQPGNSGGPIIDDKGNVVGVAVAKLDLEKMVDTYGVVPEGTNFGIKSNVVINFLESNNVDLIDVNTKKLGNEALGKTITEGTYYISCLMTMAQIQEMKERKVLFSNID
jgi:S1-C subfamily serine protease